LLDYFRDVRALTRQRLEETHEPQFDREITDEHFGPMTVRQLWAGVASSCAWHGGQIVMIANRLLPAARTAERRGADDHEDAFHGRPFG
jgi:hypothetical protein